MNCPKCGASEIENGTWPFSYECGSGGDRREKIYYSVVCVELCDLRKWREVVLSKVWIDVPEFEPRHWRIQLDGCVRGIPEYESCSVLVKQAFDAAVRKEME